jgi:hypothetical protein
VEAPVPGSRQEWWLRPQLFSIGRAPGKLEHLAGSESGMGAFVTGTTPWGVAARLRDVGGARGRVPATGAWSELPAGPAGPVRP